MDWEIKICSPLIQYFINSKMLFYFGANTKRQVNMRVSGHVWWGGGGWLGVAMLHNLASRVTRKSCRCCCCFFIEIMCWEPRITRVTSTSGLPLSFLRAQPSVVCTNCNRHYLLQHVMTPQHTASPRLLTINFFAHRICEIISSTVLISLILELKRIQVSFIGARSNVLVHYSCMALVFTV